VGGQAAQPSYQPVQVGHAETVGLDLGKGLSEPVT
jgi:hypothetical protein